jgi:hypothetical protein
VGDPFVESSQPERQCGYMVPKGNRALINLQGSFKAGQRRRVLASQFVEIPLDKMRVGCGRSNPCRAWDRCFGRSDRGRLSRGSSGGNRDARAAGDRTAKKNQRGGNNAANAVIKHSAFRFDLNRILTMDPDRSVLARLF